MKVHGETSVMLWPTVSRWGHCLAQRNTSTQWKTLWALLVFCSTATFQFLFWGVPGVSGKHTNSVSKAEARAQHETTPLYSNQSGGEPRPKQLWHICVEMSDADETDTTCFINEGKLLWRAVKLPVRPSRWFKRSQDKTNQNVSGRSSHVQNVSAAACSSSISAKCCIVRHRTPWTNPVNSSQCRFGQTVATINYYFYCRLICLSFYQSVSPCGR